MSSNPTTFRSEPADRAVIQWDDTAELHRRGDGGGILHHFKSIRRGHFGELIAFVMNLPEAEQANYAIQKHADHLIEIGEIRALFRRPDFTRHAAG